MPFAQERNVKPVGRVLALPLALAIASAAFPGFAPGSGKGGTDPAHPVGRRPSAVTSARRFEPAALPEPADSSALQVAAKSSECGEMAHVKGRYCPEVEHTCARWLDNPDSPFARCGQYAPPARCKASRVEMNFCMDRFEYTPPGEALPTNHSSLNIGAKLCKALGKRLCTEREWNFACEGEEMRPYPYGWERRPLCNQDREDLYLPDQRRQVLADRRWRAGANPECVSPFGVFDLVGNLDEPVLKDPPGVAPFRTALKGGWWMPARNRCRPATTAHDDHFTGIQIGTRCCRDAQPAAPGVAKATD